MDETKYVFCIIGMSGVGKDTIKYRLLEINSNLTELIPLTTRPPRPTEVDCNVDYIFMSNADFEAAVSNNKLMEHRKYNIVNEDGTSDIWYYGNTYPKNKYTIMIGTLEMYKKLCSDNHDVIDGNIKIFPIYIYISNEERLYRMINRESISPKPNYRELARRYFEDEKDYSINKISRFGIDGCYKDVYMFKNDNVEECAHKINQFIKCKMQLSISEEKENEESKNSNN